MNLEFGGQDKKSLRPRIIGLHFPESKGCAHGKCDMALEVPGVLTSDDRIESMPPKAFWFIGNEARSLNVRSQR